MSKIADATARPWDVNTLAGRPDSEVFSGDTLICDCRGTNVVMELEEIEANARLIVQAVNSFDILVAALTQIKVLTQRRQLPLTNEINEVAVTALKLAGEHNAD